ncbi:hypothetical protein M3Y97_00966400 [Aphelenchoides bicaudatus]|nr:hypothetical protein M3Y97_00966400 [Aphelenchoides bicaudatus]
MPPKSKKRKGKSASKTKTEESSVTDPLPITVNSNKREPLRSWKLPTIRHELILYTELFAVCCLVFIIHLLAMVPWDHIVRLNGLIFRRFYSSNITMNATDSDSNCKDGKVLHGIARQTKRLWIKFYTISGLL